MAIKVQNISAKNAQKWAKDKRDGIAMQQFAMAVQQDLANLWGAIQSITLQLDASTINNAPYTNVTNNTPSTANDQVAAATHLVYNNAGTSSLHTQP